MARLEKEQQAARRPDNTTLLASLLTQWRAAAAQAATSPLSRFCPAFKITQLYRQLHCQTQTQQVAGAPRGKLWMMIWRARDGKKNKKKTERPVFCQAQARRGPEFPSWRSDGNKLGKDREQKSGTSYTPQDLIRLWKPEAPCCCLDQIFTGRAQILVLCWWANLHVLFLREDNSWSSTRGESSTLGRKMKKGLNETKQLMDWYLLLKTDHSQKKSNSRGSTGTRCFRCSILEGYLLCFRSDENWELQTTDEGEEGVKWRRLAAVSLHFHQKPIRSLKPRALNCFFKMGLPWIW